MESSWRDDNDTYPTPASSSSSHSHAHFHKRGMSELESSLLWNTSQPNGELGLEPVHEPVSSLLSSYTTTYALEGGTSTTTRGRGKGKMVKDRVRERAGSVSIAIWAKVMDSSKGRDKVLKCVQYTLRTYLYVLGLVAAVRPLSPWFRSNRTRMRLATSSLSLTRKCLLLLNPLHPLTHLLSPTPTSASTLLRHLMDLASALADDTFCLSRLGIVSRKTGQKADKWANRFWFLTTVQGLWKVYTTIPPPYTQIHRISVHPIGSYAGDEDEDEDGEEQERILVEREREKEMRWTTYKLWSDLVFVSYDIFGLSYVKEPVQCASGMISALISTSKLYDQHWAASLGK